MFPNASSINYLKYVNILLDIISVRTLKGFKIALLMVIKQIILQSKSTLSEIRIMSRLKGKKTVDLSKCVSSL